MNQKFKTGDIVILRSGGPSMTVKEYPDPDSPEVICQWFKKDGDLMEKGFHQDTLELDEDPSSFGGVY